MKNRNTQAFEEVDTKLLTVTEGAQRLGLKPRTIRFWIWTRKIDFVKVGRAVRLREDTIEQLIQRGTIHALRERRSGATQ